MGAVYLKPGIDLDATSVSMGSVTEHGGNGAALAIDGSQETLLSATPSLELGGDWQLAGGTVLRPFARIGAALYSDPGFSVTSRFSAAPAGTGSFTTKEELDQVLADVQAGFDLLDDGGSTLRIFYDGQFGQTTQANGGGVEAEIRF